MQLKTNLKRKLFQMLKLYKHWLPLFRFKGPILLELNENFPGLST